MKDLIEGSDIGPPVFLVAVFSDQDYGKYRFTNSELVSQPHSIPADDRQNEDFPLGHFRFVFFEDRLLPDQPCIL